MSDELIAGKVVRIGDSVTLILGDCREAARYIATASCDLLLADPPYGMGKAKEGVTNDNLYGAKLDAFLMECWRACRPALKANASAYIWGNAESLWRLWYRGGLADSEPMTLRNQIIWDKPPSASPCGTPIGSEDMRSYPHGYESSLFFFLGEQGFNTNADNYWQGWEAIRGWLESEIQKVGGAAFFKSVFGEVYSDPGGVFGHKFTTSQWQFITREQYERLQAACKGDAFVRSYDDLKREHDDLKREHDDLKREFYATRAYFDNAHQNMTDVWNYPRVNGAERHGHATPKPVAMMARCIKSSCPPGGTVLDPFTGTAPTAIACIRTGRKFVGIEIDEQHFEAAEQRIRRELESGTFDFAAQPASASQQPLL
jgi:DNA modification methylase